MFRQDIAPAASKSREPSKPMKDEHVGERERERDGTPPSSPWEKRRSMSVEASRSKISYLLFYSRHLREAEKGATILASPFFFLSYGSLQSNHTFASPQFLGFAAELGAMHAE